MENNNHFYNIEAQTEEELFAKLGEIFGPYAQEIIAGDRKDASWPKKRERAKHLLGFTEQVFPEYIKQLQCYAQSASVDFLDLWTLSLEDDADFESARGEHCTSLVTDNGMLAGHIEDWNLDSAHRVALLRTKVRNKITFQIYYINTFGGSSITLSHGRIQMVDSVRHTEKINGLPKNIIARFLSDAENLDEALKRLAQTPQVSGYAYIFILPDRTVISVECTADKQIIRKVRTPFVHTNHYLNKSLQPFDLVPGLLHSRERFDRAHALLKSKMTSEQFRTLMSDTANGPDRSLFNRRTVARMIIDQRKRIAEVCLTRNEDQDQWEKYDVSDVMQYRE